VREPLAHRRARSSLLLGQTRRLAYARKRLAQVAVYLDGLLAKAEADASAAWPDQLPCPHCAAPAERVVVEARPEGGHVIVRVHPDGERCEASNLPAREATRQTLVAVRFPEVIPLVLAGDLVPAALVDRLDLVAPSRLDEALADLARAIKIDPSSPETYETRAMVQSVAANMPQHRRVPTPL
jgi:hypothetical protein